MWIRIFSFLLFAATLNSSIPVHHRDGAKFCDWEQSDERSAQDRETGDSDSDADELYKPQQNVSCAPGIDEFIHSTVWSPDGSGLSHSDVQTPPPEFCLY